MPPHRSTRLNPPITPTQPPLPPPQLDPTALQVAVVAAVVTALAQFRASGTSGGRTVVHCTQGDVPVRSRECSYKEFTNSKLRAFNGIGGIISLSQWFEKKESIFEI